LGDPIDEKRFSYFFALNRFTVRRSPFAFFVLTSDIATLKNYFIAYVLFCPLILFFTRDGLASRQF